jgi:signal transduction histidine kinase
MSASTKAHAPPAPHPRGAVLRYAVAVLAVAVALAATMLDEPYLTPQYSLLFFAAVLFSAWFGGLGPGLLATALSSVALDYFFIPPRYSLGHFDVRDAVGLAVFAGVAVVTSSLSGALRRQREQADAYAREVQRLADELSARAALRLEEKVHEAESLAAELARSNRALQAKTAEAEAAVAAKSSFLATVSHEIRTPMNAIAGYADLIASGTHGPVTAEQILDLERIQLSGRHLLSLIDDLLDQAKLQSGKLPLDVREVAVADVVAQASALVTPQLAAKGLRFECSPLESLPPVRADRARLVQVLVNLLSNAVKFTDAGAVGVRAEAAGAMVALSVWDTGPGIPPADVERVFEPFVQVSGSGGATRRGTGLGLSISRDLMRAMRGDLTVESEVGAGSVFTVRLRRADTAARSGALGGHAAGDLEPVGAAGPVATLWPPIAFRLDAPLS